MAVRRKDETRVANLTKSGSSVKLTSRFVGSGYDVVDGLCNLDTNGAVISNQREIFYYIKDKFKKSHCVSVNRYKAQPVNGYSEQFGRGNYRGRNRYRPHRSYNMNFQYHNDYSHKSRNVVLRPNPEMGLYYPLLVDLSKVRNVPPQLFAVKPDRIIPVTDDKPQAAPPVCKDNYKDVIVDAIFNTDRLITIISTVFDKTVGERMYWSIRASKILLNFYDVPFCKDNSPFLRNNEMFKDLDEVKLCFVFYAFDKTPAKIVAGYELRRRKWVFHSMYEVWFKPLGTIRSDSLFLKGRFAVYDQKSISMVENAKEVVIPLRLIS